MHDCVNKCGFLSFKKIHIEQKKNLFFNFYFEHILLYIYDTYTNGQEGGILQTLIKNRSQNDRSMNSIHYQNYHIFNNYDRLLTKTELESLHYRGLLYILYI